MAGLAGVRGKSDGLDGEARFNRPFGIAANRDGVVFIADTSNYCIRRRKPDGTVDTFAGKAGSYGFADGRRTGFDTNGMVVRVYEGDKQGKVVHVGQK